jgi:hypothetical protein
MREKDVSNVRFTVIQSWRPYTVIEIHRGLPTKHWNNLTSHEMNNSAKDNAKNNKNHGIRNVQKDISKKRRLKCI